MIQYNSNVSVIVGQYSQKLIELGNNPDALLRTVAFAVLPELKKRVHVEGKDSSGSAIGTYSPDYMKLRTGNYGNSKRFAKGKNKGELKDAGVKTKQRVATPFGKSKFAYQNIEADGIARPKYNRTDDTKVVLSLTRQMENDLSVLPSGTGYGIGYNNPDNFKKSQYNEETYKKKIWNLTEDEKLLARETAQQFTNDYLKK